MNASATRWPTEHDPDRSPVFAHNEFHPTLPADRLRPVHVQRPPPSPGAEPRQPAPEAPGPLDADIKVIRQDERGGLWIRRAR